jgi:hypothetical protein
VLETSVVEACVLVAPVSCSRQLAIREKRGRGRGKGITETIPLRVRLRINLVI